MRYTDGPDGSWEGRRPEGIPAENVETELIEVLEPSVSHSKLKRIVPDEHLKVKRICQVKLWSDYCYSSR